MREKYSPALRPASRAAARNSRTKSRPAGLLVDLNSVYALSNIQKPSWCLAVRTAYCIPAPLAAAIHSRMSQCLGSNSIMRGSYSPLGMRSTLRTHSPRAGMAYSPQCRNRPNRARVNQAVRRS